MPRTSETAEPQPAKYLTLDEVAGVLNISRRSAYDKMLAGYLLGVNVSNGRKPSWRVTRASLDAYEARIAAEAEARFGRAS